MLILNRTFIELENKIAPFFFLLRNFPSFSPSPSVQLCICNYDYLVLNFWFK